MPKILDNIHNKFKEELLMSLKGAKSFDASIGYFNLRGWQLLAEAVDKLPGGKDGVKARILVGITEKNRDEVYRLAMPDSISSINLDNATRYKQKNQIIADYRSQLQIGIPSIMDEKALRLLIQQIENKQVQIRAYTRHRLHAKLYFCHRVDQVVKRVAYVGSSNLTKSGLQEQGELNVDITDEDATQKLLNWFEDRWIDDSNLDITPELLKTLNESWVSSESISPFFIYLKMAYHLSQEAREGLNTYMLPPILKNVLLDFQEEAVKIATRIVVTKGGVMIGDVVGLGKTLVATAIACLLQEKQGFETLVICPKNLISMWEGYFHRYEIRGKVLSLSKTSKELENERRHRLVIIDESHNLRNEKRMDYKAVQNYISNNQSKVLLLSATPYNKQFDDLANQLGLFVSNDIDLGIQPEKAIKEKGLYNFKKECNNQISNLAAFRKSRFVDDWQTLMSQYLIRRTRQFIMENYAAKDEEEREYLTFTDNKRFYFPKRTIVPIENKLINNDAITEMITDTTLSEIQSLKLPRYQMGNYIDINFLSKDEKEKDLIKDLKKAARGNLTGFTRTNMFKRLSSSGPAFLKTLHRHHFRNKLCFYALSHQKSIPVGKLDDNVWAYENDVDPEDNDEMKFFDSNSNNNSKEAYERLCQLESKKMRWANSSMFNLSLLKDLKHDIQIVESMLNRFGRWKPRMDGKLLSLKEILTVKHVKDKVLIFTESVDTALYLKKELEKCNITNLGLITGDTENIDSIVNCFSPKSNKDKNVKKDLFFDEIRILICTDVLAEGQNLQDSHIVINYDLPWAIVKLIQRAGRIDRIGQESPEVIVYSILPVGKVEDTIKLRERIRHRLGENAQLLGSEEKFLGDASEKRIITELYDELKPNDGLQEVDPISGAYEIWRQAEKDYPQIANKVKQLPNVIYSTKKIANNQSQGVVVHIKTPNNDNHFLFIPIKGEVRKISPQEALKLAKCKYDTPAITRFKNHHSLTQKAFDFLNKPKEENTALPGITRHKIWAKFVYPSKNLSILGDKSDLNTKLKVALEDINQFDLYEEAKQKIDSAFRKHNDKEIAELIIDLNDNQKLCIKPLKNASNSEYPSIICSLGLRFF